MRRSISFQPLRRSWSVRIGRVRFFSLPWYWDRARDRLRRSWTARRSVVASPAHHPHYCEGCDHPWVHDGEMCAQPWSWPCPTCVGASRDHPVKRGALREREGSLTPGAYWLMVVRRDRAELYRDLQRNFETDAQVRVLRDRRQRARRAVTVPVTTERRRGARRRVLTARETVLWDAGFGLYHRDDALQGFEPR